MAFGVLLVVIMDLDTLRIKCKEIKGVAKIRKARLGDGIFLKYREVLLSSGMFHIFTDFIHLDDWENDLQRTKAEYERFFK